MSLDTAIVRFFLHRRTYLIIRAYLIPVPADTEQITLFQSLLFYASNGDLEGRSGTSFKAGDVGVEDLVNHLLAFLAVELLDYYIVYEKQSVNGLTL